MKEATLEQSLKEMIKSGQSASAQASFKTDIDVQRLEIQKQEAKNRDKLAELERGINKVKENALIVSLADQIATNPAAEKKAKDQEL